MIHVMHLITRMDMGGSAQNTLASCAGLASRYGVIMGFGPTTESRMTDSEKISVSDGLKSASMKGVRIFQIRHLLRRLSPVRDALALFEIVRMITRHRPMVLHTHSSKAGLLGRLAGIVTRVPILVHTPHGHVFYGHFGDVASRFFLFVERLMDRFTDVTVALTQGELEDYVKLHVTSPRKLERIHSGVDISRFSVYPADTGNMRSALGIDPGATIIGTVGWLLPVKGPDLLLRAMIVLWKHYPDLHLVFVGKGEMQNELKTMAFASGKAAHVHFLGWREDVSTIFPVFDIFVLPSRNEGMGRVIVEAMAAGRPVVASNVGGIPDLVEDGVNGLLFPSEDMHALVEALRALVENPGRALAMGQRGMLTCRDYNTEAMISKLDKLYERLISRQPISRTS